MDRVSFGMGPFAIGRAATELRTRFTDLIARAINADVELVATKTYPELLQKIREGRVQIAWLPPAVFLQALDQIQITLLLSAVRPGGALYHGVLFVPEESARKGVEDLYGTTVGWVDRQSCGGFLFPCLAVMESGYSASELFEEEYLFASHTAVVAAVAAGRVDVGATYMNVQPTGDRIINTGWTDAGLDLSAMHPVLRSRPIPSDVICTAKVVGMEVEQKIATALAALHETSEGAEALGGLLQAERLVPANLRDYDVVRAAQNVAFSRIRPTFNRISRTPPLPGKP